MEEAVKSIESKDVDARKALAADPKGLRNIFHAAMALDAASDPKIVSFLQPVLEDHAVVAAECIPRRLNLVDSAVARKRYQHVVGKLTRWTTFDLFTESAAGYAKLVALCGSFGENDWDCTWVDRIVGEYNLEPFRMLGVWLDMMYNLRTVERPILCSQAPRAFVHHRDWYAVLMLKLAGLRLKFPTTEDGTALREPLVRFCGVLGGLVTGGLITQDVAWQVVAPEPEQLTEFEAQIISERGQQQVKNALSMAMPLVDDDDEDDIDVDMDDEVPEVGSSAVNDTPAAKPTDLLPASSVELALAFIGGTFKSMKRPYDELLVGPVRDKMLAYVHEHRIAAGLSPQISVGLSQIIPECYNEPDFWETYVAPISHAIREPAWSFLNEKCEGDLSKFRKYLLPSIDLHGSTQSFLFKLSDAERYSLYTELLAEVAVHNEFVKLRFARAERDAKDVLKRLTKKDAEDVIVPQLLAVIARCPMPSLVVLVNQVESYNIGQLVAQNSAKLENEVKDEEEDNSKDEEKEEDENEEEEDLGHFTLLAMDMLPLILMQQLTAGGRQAQQSDGLFESRWFRLLAQFAGDVAVAQPTFNFVVLVKFVLQQFANNDISQVVVFEQLFRNLTGEPLLSNLSEVQLEGLSAAPIVADVISGAITGQWHPQRERFMKSLGSLAEIVLAALSYGYSLVLSMDADAKVIAQRRDNLSSLALAYAKLLGQSNADLTLNLQGPFAKVAERFRTPLDLSSLDPENNETVFWQLDQYDVSFDNALYNDLVPSLAQHVDPKAVERAALAHRLRAKSVTQSLGVANMFKMEAADLRDLVLPRLLLSPRDALFVSRFLQLLPQCYPNEYTLGGLAEAIIERGTLLAVLNCASPLETESFAMFVSDLFVHLPQNYDLGPLHSTLTEAVLEVMHPNAFYLALANSFSLLQRALVVFPAFTEFGNPILRRVELLTTTTEGDLSTAVQSLHPQLARRQHLWAPEGQSTPTKELLDGYTETRGRLTQRLAASLTPRRIEKAPEPSGSASQCSERRRGGRRRHRNREH